MLSSSIFAQITKRKAENRVNISYTPQWYLHSLGGVNHYGDDLGQQVIYPRNAFGQTLEIEYQRTTRNGLIMSLGLQTGMEKHNIDVHYNFGYVDAEAPELKNAWLDTQFKATVNRMAIRVMAGYKWESPFKAFPGWDIETKAGIALRRNTNGGVAGNYYTVLTYKKDDTFFRKEVAFNYIGFGSPHLKFPSGFRSAFEFYVGLTKNMNVGFIRTLSIGIDGTYGLRKNYGSSGGAHITLYTLDNYTGNLLSESRHEYSSPDFALGIKLAVGLWPNIKDR